MFYIPYTLVVIGILILGLIIGGLSNVTSGGAGFFTIYAITNYAGLSIQDTNGTVLAASTIIVSLGVISFYRKRQVDTRLGITVGLSGVAGAFFAARWASTIQSSILEQAFGAFTLILACYTSYLFLTEWRNKRKQSTLSPSDEKDVSHAFGHSQLPQGNAQLNQQSSRFTGNDPASLSVQILKGALIGVATGLFGVGLASLSVILFMLLFKLDTKMILGTSLFASFFRYLGGAAGYISVGHFNTFYFVILVVGGGIGSIIGARIILKDKSGSNDIYIKMLQVGILLFVSYEFLLKFALP